MLKKGLAEEVLMRGVDKIYPSKKVFYDALSSKKIRIYWGTDPTSPHLHIGHAASLLFLKKLQELGHEIVILVGDFTARIGDPTDKKAVRRQLTDKEVKENLKTFKKQVSKIVSFTGKNPAKLMFNSKWLSKMSFEDVIELSANFTVQQMIARDMFQDRIKNDKPIGLHEFFYPLMQGYDSVAMDVDAEVGGTDQTFNMLAGRDLMKSLKNKEKFVVAMKLLVNSEGKKMSKTEGDLINLDDHPNDMFGKTMAIKDEMMFQIAELSTQMPIDKIEDLRHAVTKLSMNPRDAKARIAHALVETYYGEKEADEAEKEFNRVFKEKEMPEDMPIVRSPKKEMEIVDLIFFAKLAKSKGEARRLVQQGGVKIDGRKLLASEIIKIPKKGIILQVGKRHFARVII